MRRHLLPKPTGGNSSDRLIERKQMSTKTTFKRIALVAVAALGLGVLSSVAPASAAYSALTTEYVTSITSSNASVPVAGAAGGAVVTTVTFKTSTTATTTVANPNVLLISKPATSTLAYQANTTDAVGKYEFLKADGSTDAAGAALTLDQTDGTGAVVNRSATGTALAYAQVKINAWYDVPGTYKFVVWDDLNSGDGSINGSEYSQVITIVVADGTAAITGTVAAFNSTSGAGSTNGSLVKISLKDAAGNAAGIDSAGGVKATVSGSAIITTGSNTTASYIIPRTSFNGSGNTWINVTDATAEIVTVTLSGVGSTTISGNVPSLTFVTIAGVSTTTPVKTGTGSKIAGAAGSSTAGLGSTVSLKTGVAAAATPVKENVNVTDTSGTITGKATAAYSVAVTNGATGCTECGSFSIATGFTEAGQAFTVNVGGGSAETITASRAALTAGTITVADSTRTVAKGSANSFTITVKDQYGINFT
jgi:trimeric autotransporter adhesin